MTFQPREALELVDFTRRFWIGAALTIPIVLLAMCCYVGMPIRNWAGERLDHWLKLMLATRSFSLSAGRFSCEGWNSFSTLTPNMFSLIAFSVFAA